MSGWRSRLTQRDRVAVGVALATLALAVGSALIRPALDRAAFKDAREAYLATGQLPDVPDPSDGNLAGVPGGNR